MTRPPTIRIASQFDTDNLLALESCNMPDDSLTRARIEYILTRVRSTVLIAEYNGKIAGAIYFLWKCRKSGELYNIVIDPEYMGRGVIEALLVEGELEATRRGLKNLYIEVSSDSNDTILFFKNQGYVIQKNISDYKAECIIQKMSKLLASDTNTALRLKVPYYSQILEFASGSACLIMALLYFRAINFANPELEYDIWNENKQLFLIEGIGGIGPYALALAAIRRGLSARIMSTTDSTPILHKQNELKRDYFRLIHTHMKESAVGAGAIIMTYEYDFDDIRSALYRRLVPITLINTQPLIGDIIPRWVLITGFDKQNVFIHDPDEKSYPEHVVCGQNWKMPIKEFMRLASHGKETYRCTVFIGRK